MTNPHKIIFKVVIIIPMCVSDDASGWRCEGEVMDTRNFRLITNNTVDLGSQKKATLSNLMITQMQFHASETETKTDKSKSIFFDS